MPKLLLSSSQVGALLTSSIIIFSTLALFFAGYTLQQRTVRSLQAVIKPPIPVLKHPPIPPPSPLDPRAKAARAPGSRDDHRRSLHSFLSHGSAPQVDWTKLAYVQIVKSHADICSAVMFFASLHRQKSAPRRVLLFPQNWAIESKGEITDPWLDTSIRLLRKAARRYRVIIQPMPTTVKGAEVQNPDSYSLATAFSLTSYNHLLYLSSPGVLLNSAPLDSLLAYAPSQPFVALPGLHSEAPTISDMLYLFRPSKPLFANLTSTISQTPTSDFDLLRNAFQIPDAYFPEYLLPPSSGLIATTNSLTAYSDHSISRSFNVTDWMDSTAYVRLWDEELPGPEYDIPYHERRAVAPKDDGARVVWERLYSVFREERMEVCGLDLETYRGPAYGKKKVAKEEMKEVKKGVEEVVEEIREKEVEKEVVRKLDDLMNKDDVPGQDGEEVPFDIPAVLEGDMGGILI